MEIGIQGKNVCNKKKQKSNPDKKNNSNKKKKEVQWLDKVYSFQSLYNTDLKHISCLWNTINKKQMDHMNSFTDELVSMEESYIVLSQLHSNCNVFMYTNFYQLLEINLSNENYWKKNKSLNVLDQFKLNSNNTQYSSKASFLCLVQF